jgi:hypothetical protein
LGIRSKRIVWMGLPVTVFMIVALSAIRRPYRRSPAPVEGGRGESAAPAA